MNNCYVYKWTHKPTFMWYVGSRTAKNCHPGDGYICGSKIVRPLIKSNPSDWERTIIFVGEKQEVLELETEILQLVDARNDPRSFNQHNNDGVPMPIVKTPWNKGKKLSAKQSGWTDERRVQAREMRLGKPSGSSGTNWSDESKNRQRIRYTGENNPRFGVNVSLETRDKIRKSKIGKSPNENTKKKISNSMSKVATGRKIIIDQNGKRTWSK